jgi:hypothetical protein
VPRPEEARTVADDREDAAWLKTRREVVDAVRGGLITGAEVMAQLGVNASVFGGWCRAEQMRRARAVATAGSSTFRRVSLVGPKAGARVADVVLRGGRRVCVASGFDAVEVRRLVEALASC